jgi:hypothetical protein
MGIARNVRMGIVCQGLIVSLITVYIIIIITVLDVWHAKMGTNTKMADATPAGNQTA